MITINTAEITEGGLKIDLNFELDTDFEATKLYFKTPDDYFNESPGVDISYKLSNTGPIEDIEIEPSDVNVNIFTGIFYLTIFYVNPTVPGRPRIYSTTVALSNLDPYYNCVTDYILKTNMCSDTLFSNSSSQCGNNDFLTFAITGNLLIDSIMQSLTLGKFVDAGMFLLKLNKICNKCTSCKDPLTLYSTNKGCVTCNSYKVTE